MSCEQRPDFVRYDRYSKTGYDSKGESKAGTMILRNMHLVKPSDIPPRPDICGAVPMPARTRKGKK